MFPYADYEFYKKRAHGEMTEDEFNQYVLESSSFLRCQTLGRADHSSSDDLKYATCAIADLYKAEREKYVDGVVKSENNDGYSVSFQTEVKEGETLEELRDRKAQRIARQYLLTTGLLFRKVGGRCDYECKHHHL